VTTPAPRSGATATAPATPPLLRGLAIASLVTNIAIVVTGGVVRLTASGLGCPTWPRCTETSFVPHGELGIHGAIEFGNRMVTFLLAAVAIATFVAAWRYGRRSLTRLALLLALGVPAQDLVGGVTVLTDLNPWIVAFHLLVSMAMIGVAVVLCGGCARATAASPTCPAAWPGWCSRPSWWWCHRQRGHRRQPVRRTSTPQQVDPASLSQLRTDFVFPLLGLTVGALLAPGGARAAPRGPHRVGAASRRARPGLVGFVQSHRPAGGAGHFHLWRRLVSRRGQLLGGRTS
jgi:cytochrome c oxidase assembly protein subunit 15